MRLVAQPSVNLAPLDAQIASDLRWLAAMLRWIGGIFRIVSGLAWVRGCPLLRDALAATKARAAQKLRACAGDLRTIIFRHAYARLRITTGRSYQAHFPGRSRTHLTRRHVRLARRATAGLISDLHAGTLRQRAKRLAAHLANLEPLIARTLRRLTPMWRFPRQTRHALVVTNDAYGTPASVGTWTTADTS